MTTPNQDDKRSVRTLADLRALSEAATPAPWRVAIGSSTPPPIMFDTTGTEGVVLVDQAAIDEDPEWMDDATLIAAMRNALPALLDEVEASRKAIADVLALHRLCDDSCHETRHAKHCRACSTPGWPCATYSAITPDAPASEAHGRPLHSSSTEQED